MANLLLLLLCTTLLAFTCIGSELVQHTFRVQNLVVERLCQKQTIVTVNGMYPGPTIHVKEGDTLLVLVVNESPYDITIHWHGLHMLLSGWADGAAYVTQCPIRPGDHYAYRFNITEQEGTLWWHAHTSWLRVTVHGAFIIYPTAGRPYPFEKPYKEIPILLGEWWNDNIMDVMDKYLHVDAGFYMSDAFTINGQPGDFYSCSSKDTYKLEVKQGKTYLLRIINVGLNQELFFKIANHKMTIVAVDACYTNQYVSDMVVIAPGQTIDVLLRADQPPTSYYMTARAYVSAIDKTMIFDNTTTSGIIIYENTILPSSILPIMPSLPDFYNHSIVHYFFTSLTGLMSAPFWVSVPQVVDEHMFITVGIGVFPCNEPEDTSSQGPPIFGNMNNISFQLPTKMSLLEAYFRNIDGVYTTDFPQEPPLKFDYTNPSNAYNMDLMCIAQSATKVKKLKYNTTVEIVLQNTAFASVESHPIHLHGFDFHVLAQGYGNYYHEREEKNFNLVNPQRRNTIAVPPGGWAVIRFRANNPGAWLMHCHLEAHMSVGLATAFVIENGPTPSTSLPPPPLDLPKCSDQEADPSKDEPVRLPREKPIQFISKTRPSF